MRLANGVQGHSSRWDLTDINDVIRSLGQNEFITANPVGVRVTDADKEAITDKGYSPVLGTKAMSSHAKSGLYEEIGANVPDTIRTLHASVLAGDAQLEDFIIDLRRERESSSSTPATSQPTQTIAAPQETEKVAIALASIPPAKYAERYIHRDINGIEDFAIYDHARDEGYEVLIYGPTGPGKTTSVVAWAASRKLRMAAVSGNAALEPSQLVGKYVPDGAGGFEWIDGPVTDVVRNGGVLLLDEVNFISPKIYTVLYSLLDARRCLILLDHHGETIEAHPDLTIFATMNPDYLGTNALNAAFRNRFSIQIPWDYDDAVEAKLVKSKALLVIAKQLRNEAAKGEFETPISTNMLMELETLIPSLGYDFAVGNFIAHFDKEEQDKVQLVFVTHEYNIKEDFSMNVVQPVIDKGDEKVNISVTESVADDVDAWLKKNTI
jgi:nitric oxide reductase NorQ protein